MCAIEIEESLECFRLNRPQFSFKRLFQSQNVQKARIALRIRDLRCSRSPTYSTPINMDTCIFVKNDRKKEKK